MLCWKVQIIFTKGHLNFKSFQLLSSEGLVAFPFRDIIDVQMEYNSYKDRCSPGEFEGHSYHHRQPRGEDRHPRRLHPREQDRVRQHEDHGPLAT